ncbi:MAG: transketolase [Coriobacteriia bacterium]|nr:transketolase [Coriobacteriia bacterium]
MTKRGFRQPVLDPSDAAAMRERAVRLRGAILTMTSLAASGHPGGSMSSLEIYLTLYSFASLRPGEPAWAERDRVIVSHGHTSPGVYCALADAGFFELDDVVAHFRRAGSLFEGHVERAVPGVEWSSGNLGQGLSAGVGSALASRLTGGGWHTFVAMSDGEQMKGQVGEARRLAAKYGLGSLTAVVDLNGIQISGRTADVMPVDVAAGFEADGWRVIEVDGHDVSALYGAVADAVADPDRPCAILARTVIGKGVSFMEGEPEFHGRGLTAEEYPRAMAELGLDPGWIERARERRATAPATAPASLQPPVLALAPGAARTYTRGKDTDNRSAWGTALADVAEANQEIPIAVFDCDLMTSVKTEKFAAARPEGFIQCGVGEHNVATVAGAASANGVLAFWSDFGVFGCDEVYNQQRLNDINEAHLKVALTHCGLDVGEDGKTHQCLDYVGAFRDFFGWKVVVPADPNQTDRAVRAAAAMPGCVAIAMGRSKLPVLLEPDGSPCFAGDYEFTYGAIDIVREGDDVSLLVMGTVAGAAVDAADALAAEGISVAVAVVASPLDLDDEAMRRLAAAPVLLTAEDHGVRTGLGASVAEWLALSGVATRFVRLGVDGYRSSGAAAAVLAREELDAAGIAETIRAALRS